MPIGSHIIPRFYLEQFANPARRKGRPGKVWVYQKGKQAQLRATDSQGYENGYFGYVRPDGSLDESLESELAILEDRCSDLLVCSKSELCDLRSLTNRNTLAFYASLLFARSSSRRKFYRTNWEKLREPFEKLQSSEAYVRDAAEHFTNLTGELIAPEVMRGLIQKQGEQFFESNKIKNNFVRDLLLNVGMIKDEFVSKPWQVWEAPAGKEFATSDNPLVTFLRLTQEVWHPGYGFRTPNVVIAFPLAPTTCLTMGIVGREFERVSEATVTKLNDIVIRASDRFVYSKTYTEKIARMVEEFGGTSVPGETAFVGQFPNAEAIEDKLRELIGIRKRKTVATAGR
jgi:hypothetical protein